MGVEQGDALLLSAPTPALHLCAGSVLGPGGHLVGRCWLYSARHMGFTRSFWRAVLAHRSAVHHAAGLALLWLKESRRVTLLISVTVTAVIVIQGPVLLPTRRAPF